MLKAAAATAHCSKSAPQPPPNRHVRHNRCRCRCRRRRRPLLNSLHISITNNVFKFGVTLQQVGTFTCLLMMWLMMMMLLMLLLMRLTMIQMIQAFKPTKGEGSCTVQKKRRQRHGETPWRI